MVISSTEILRSIDQMYRGMTVENHCPCKCDDLDMMFFLAEEHKESEKKNIRACIDRFFSENYQDLIKTLENKPSHSVCDMYRFIRSMGKHHSGILATLLQDKTDRCSCEDIYNHMKTVFSQSNQIHSITFEQMVRWGYHIRAEILNDGFCDDAIYNNIANFACTLAYIDAYHE